MTHTLPSVDMMLNAYQTSIPCFSMGQGMIFKSEQLVSFFKTYSMITLPKFHENSPNLPGKQARMSSIQHHQEKWIWLSISRENCHRIRGTLKAADSLPYGVLLHESRQGINMPITPKVQTRASQIIYQAVRKKICQNQEGLLGRKSPTFARQARSYV